MEHEHGAGSAQPQAMLSPSQLSRDVEADAVQGYVSSPSSPGLKQVGRKSCYSVGEGGTSISQSNRVSFLMLQCELKGWEGE